MIKNVLAILMFALLIAAVASCKKKTTAPTEANLVVQTTPANQSNNLNILGPDFPLKVEITSAMPPSGVKIDVSANQEGSGNPAFFTASNSTSAPQNNYTIINTPSGVTCVVNVTVTSLSLATNVWKGSYRYSKK